MTRLPRSEFDAAIERVKRLRGIGAPRRLIRRSALMDPDTPAANQQILIWIGQIHLANVARSAEQQAKPEAGEPSKQ